MKKYIYEQHRGGGLTFHLHHGGARLVCRSIALRVIAAAVNLFISSRGKSGHHRATRLVKNEGCRVQAR